MATKRKLKFSDYSKVETEVHNADYGVVTSLSPLKKSHVGSNYYIGEVCDGKQTLRFVGFSTSQQKQLGELKEKKQSVEIQNCQIKKYIWDSDNLEVLLKGTTKIITSPNKFENMIKTSQRKSHYQPLTTFQLTILTAKVKVANCSTPVSRSTTAYRR